MQIDLIKQNWQNLFNIYNNSMRKIYITKPDEILIKDLSCFCIKQILECGQVFRFTRLPELEKNEVVFAYRIISKDKTAIILESDNQAKILTKDVNYFINYFDLDADYESIKENFVEDEILKCAVNYGYGIRILNQDLLEVIISFIISANNNIKRIQKSLNLICERFGKNMGDYYAFPSLKELSKINEQQFRECGVGFRAKYLVSTINDLIECKLENLTKLNNDELKSKLISFKGIGPKVADCILLFGFHDMSVFPVDTWVIKIFNAYYTVKQERNVKVINKFLVSKFKNLAGYAQQYLFYYKRELEGVKI